MFGSYGHGVIGVRWNRKNAANQKIGCQASVQHFRKSERGQKSCNASDRCEWDIPTDLTHDEVTEADRM